VINDYLENIQYYIHILSFIAYERMAFSKSNVWITNKGQSYRHMAVIP